MLESVILLESVMLVDARLSDNDKLEEPVLELVALMFVVVAELVTDEDPLGCDVVKESLLIDEPVVSVELIEKAVLEIVAVESTLGLVAPLSVVAKVEFAVAESEIEDSVPVSVVLADIPVVKIMLLDSEVLGP